MSGLLVQFVLLASWAIAVVQSGVPGVYELVQQDKLQASTVSTSDFFGWQMDVDADTLIVSTINDGVGGSNTNEAGSAAIFHWDSIQTGWVEEAILKDSDFGRQDYLATDVAIYGDIAVAGAENKDDTGVDDNDGAVLVFVRTYDMGGANPSWTQNQTIFASTPIARAFFGSAVDLDGDWLVVGARNEGATSDGAAYVYKRSGGSFGTEQRLTPTTPITGEGFGVDVTIEGELLVVGTTDGDRAVVFTFNSVNGMWEQDTVLSEGTNDGFGKALDIDGGEIVVGAPDKSAGRGAVYIYEVGYATQPTLIEGPVGTFGNFGKSVSMRDNFLAVGAPLENGDVTEQGFLYVYNTTLSMGDWDLTQKVAAKDPEQEDRFGRSVAIHSQSIIVGAIKENTLGSSSGSIYVFVENPCSEPPSVSPSLDPSGVPSAEPSMTPSIAPSELPSISPSVSFEPTTTVSEGCSERFACDLDKFVDRLTNRYWMSRVHHGRCRSRCFARVRIPHRQRRGWECGKC